MSDRARWSTAAAIGLGAAALLWRGLEPGGLVWAIPLALVTALAIAVAIVLTNRRRLATLAPGERWSGSVAVELDGYRTCPATAGAAPRPGLKSGLLLSQGLVPGVLTIAADEIAWRPGVAARWSGARPWRVLRSDIAAVETAASWAPGGRGLTIRLLDGSAIPLRATAARGLVPALEQLRLHVRGAQTA